jgi:shikimate dehydrogenase
MTTFKRRQSKIVGLIGYPLSHSLSPIFQQAAFDYYNLPIVYEAWETHPEAVGEAIARMRAPDCLGANVTIPHKQAVIPLLDHVDEFAARIGAVNTIVNRDGKLDGFNTDSTGFLRALEDDASYDPDGKRAAVIGAGGASRGICAALLSAGAVSLTVFNRNADRAVGMVQALRAGGFESEIRIEPLAPAALARVLPEIDLIVNTTPIGMKNGPQPDSSPVPADLLPAGALVYDLVYNPAITPLIADATARGLQTLSGIAMLVYQGAYAFEMWTGQKAPIGLMFERLRQALYGE